MTSEFWSAFDRVQPRYAQLAREMAQEIDHGSFSVGTLLPTEAQLCQRYGVSRHTVRAALKELQSIGLVSSRQGVGTRVIASEPPMIFQMTWKSMEEICNPNNKVSFHPVKTGTISADAKLARKLGCTSGRTFAYIQLLAAMEVGGKRRSVGLTEVNVDVAFSDITKNPNFDEASLILELEKLCGEPIQRIEMSLRAGNVSEEQSSFLKAKKGSPIVSIRKTYSCQSINHLAISESIWLSQEFNLNYCIERKA